MSKWWTIVLFALATPAAHAQDTVLLKTYYDEGKTHIKEIISVLKADSTLHGLYQAMYSNGSLSVTGYYHLGASDSLWVYYYENGKISTKGYFSNNKKHKSWEYYFENGNPKAKGSYQSDIPHGQWTYYFESGQEKSIGMYFQGKKEGIWNYFYEEGSLKAQAYFTADKGLYKEFYPNGKLKIEGFIQEGKSVDQWTYYHESGAIEAEGVYRDGLKDGKWTYYHENGQLAGQGEYSHGDKSGVWKYYYDDGSLSSQGPMLEDHKNGFWKLYYPTGEVKGEANLNLGTGTHTEYYASGKKKATGPMKAGKKHGRWTYFNEEGVEDGTAKFENGTGHYSGFYPDGSLKMTGTIEDNKRVGEWTLYEPDGSVAGTYKPVYEEDKPIFRTSQSLKLKSEKRNNEKPEYRYRNKRLRYFNPRINEYTGFIIGTNPVWSVIGQIPIAFEYYIQERQGYEAQITLHKKPMFASSSNTDVTSVGADLALRQKFYHRDTNLGMFYFGHQIQGGYLYHEATALSPSPSPAQADEMRFAYGLFIGDRWMQRVEDSGLTVDFNFGFAVGKRLFSNNSKSTNDPFGELNQDAFYLPVVFTLNIGFAGPKRRTTSF
ncbi:toxin-antitoxin system YwqK family antitoxin [Marinoscillum furvescens]|uniref:Antitoxin component YwqK of YwqJK toxin-antitoxin module n=1 Tax=Marinoscillum furvescens DSM 4134 TaxID=1122208 RepID=A0A3D9L0D7_MARFU|nr:toxin-antitoxin system YwqK family antitoxin [Marinoscillum furvescens]RED95631.1 antitoxin component YwqK of YwqJK toxin-antitoxin module [Marinoscillum furvescens DSM 4134]